MGWEELRKSWHIIKVEGEREGILRCEMDGEV